MNLVVRFETWVNVVGNANTLKRESSRHCDKFITTWTTNHIGIKGEFYFECDHTSTNAPDPIRTPQLSVLGRE